MAGIAVSYLSVPLYKMVLMEIWRDQFSNYTFACDQSMRVHFMAKQKVALDTTESNVDELKAAEIGLLDCQKYDLLQKKMKRWGLSDNEVGEMVLQAAEAESGSLRKVIQIHEIHY
ncbi:TIGR03982 family His-Xaa-Ser system protein [Hoeflea sp. WL0058]|uniref:TIGR03982 family His-Xaa-Ser system protein n=1 Tax=Flavimaribacter sediminis TaxID=2865987 RepID=A0AAE3D3T4_9HYPH|nr:TIGR03982 family His-Xaa-Ser system protein [Flavimaribacter sediminis]